MRKKFLTVTIFAFLVSGSVSFASGEHAHDDEHADHDDDGHEELEESPIVGADRGITATSAKSGIKLSPEATKNFALQSLALSGAGPWLVPQSAVVYSAREVNLYRFRDGFYKRIDFKTLLNDSKGIRVGSNELQSGDSIVTHGLGLLRVAEIAAFGGAPEGHSH